MYRTCPLLWILVALVVDCHRGAATIAGSGEAGADAGAVVCDAAKLADSGVRVPTTEEVEAFLRSLHTDRIPRTPEDNRIVSFVDRSLDEIKRPFPRPRMFLIDKRTAHAWVVTCLDLEYLRNGGSGGDVSVHVSEKNGKLTVDEIAVGGY